VVGSANIIVTEYKHGFADYKKLWNQSSCDCLDEKNIGSAKVIMNNGAVLMDEVIGKNSGKLIKIYHIYTP